MSKKNRDNQLAVIHESSKEIMNCADRIACLTALDDLSELAELDILRNFGGIRSCVGVLNKQIEARYFGKDKQECKNE